MISGYRILERICTQWTVHPWFQELVVLVLTKFCPNIKQTFYRCTIHMLQLCCASVCQHYTIMLCTVLEVTLQQNTSHSSNGHRHNLRGGEAFAPPPILFLPNKFFILLLNWREANKKNWTDSGGTGCMYIKDWFKPIFLFLTWLPHKLKFLIPTYLTEICCETVEWIYLGQNRDQWRALLITVMYC
jgi:hypothetical protein